jgi:hypothetical protein
MYNIPQFKKPRKSKFKPTPHDEIKSDIEKRAESFVRNRSKQKTYPQQRIEFVDHIDKIYPGYRDIARFFVNRHEAMRREPQPKVIYPNARKTTIYNKPFDPYETDEVIDLENIKPGFD